MENRARFCKIKDVDITYNSTFNQSLNEYLPKTLYIPTTFVITWPDGNPCSLAELFLIYKFRRGASIREDGGSLRATASKIIQIIQYCWTIKKDFWELDDDNFQNFVQHLASERKPERPMVRARNNNSVRAIVASCVEFLIWIQDHILVNTYLIGTSSQHRIRLVEKKVMNHRIKKMTIEVQYHILPPPDTREPKHAIGREQRNALWEAVANMSQTRVACISWAKNEETNRKAAIFLQKRRELLLDLLESTGARPGELARLKVSENINCYKSGSLILTTLKRRRDIDRSIKLQPEVAIRLVTFIEKHRRQILEHISFAGFTASPSDRVFIGLYGNPLSERSLESEFVRISSRAGLANIQSCMSMFRHRFITKQIAIHLRAYLGATSKRRDLFTDADYRTILKKVATITGHSNELSLMHYIDLAWSELNYVNQIDIAQAIDHSIESTTNKISSLIGSLEASKDAPLKALKDLLIEATSTLRGMQNEIQSNLQNSCESIEKAIKDDL
ncbi:Phage integrase family protein [compost metagenome]